jgi:hypothetical protein
MRIKERALVTLPMLLPMMDSVPKPRKKGAKSLIPADGRLHADGDGFEASKLSIGWIQLLHPEQEGVVARRAQYLAGSPGSSLTSTVAQASLCAWTDLTSEVLEWLSSRGRSA